ncbi:MAG: chaperone modulator CbpM [Acetobacteraceae bacterium]
MISFSAVLARLPALDAETLRDWIAEEWVRPEHRGGQLLFQEIDVARLHLILDLRQTLEVEQGAVPVVLSLLDQLHETRRQMRHLLEALDASEGGETAQDVLRRLSGR